jgi:hypothetical protein
MEKKKNSNGNDIGLARWVLYLIAVIAAIGLILSTQKTKYGPPKPPVSRGG